MPSPFNTPSVVVVATDQSVRQYRYDGSLVQTVAAPSSKYVLCCFDVHNNLFLGKQGVSTSSVEIIDKVLTNGTGPALFHAYTATPGQILELRSGSPDGSIVFATDDIDTTPRFERVNALGALVQSFGVLPDSVHWQYAGYGHFAWTGLSQDGSTIISAAVKFEFPLFDQPNVYKLFVFSTDIATDTRTILFASADDEDEGEFGGPYRDLELLPDGSWLAITRGTPGSWGHTIPVQPVNKRAIQRYTAGVPSTIAIDIGADLVIGSHTLLKRNLSAFSTGPQHHPTRNSFWFSTVYLPGVGFSTELWEYDLATGVPTLMLSLPSTTIRDFTFCTGASQPRERVTISAI